MISRTGSLESPREIIHSSDQFFKSYEVVEGFSIVFPRKSVQSLSVHSYTHCFQDTDMKEVLDILERIK